MHTKHSSFFELHGVSTWLSTMQDLDTAKQTQTVNFYLFSLLFFSNEDWRIRFEIIPCAYHC